MELKLLYLCDGPYHSVLFQTHLWLGILYSFYCKSLEAEELLFHSVLHPSFLALSSPAFFHILPFFCIFEEGDMLFLYYLESSVCAHTPPPHSPRFPVHPSAQTAFLKEAFVATPDQNRLSCFTPSQTLCFSFRALVCDYLSLSLFVNKIRDHCITTISPALAKCLVYRRCSWMN